MMVFSPPERVSHTNVHHLFLSVLPPPALSYNKYQRFGGLMHLIRERCGVRVRLGLGILANQGPLLPLMLALEGREERQDIDLRRWA